MFNLTYSATFFLSKYFCLFDNNTTIITCETQNRNFQKENEEIWSIQHSTNYRKCFFAKGDANLFFAKNCVNLLAEFWKFSVVNFHTQIAQIFVDLKSITFKEKMNVATFWATLENILQLLKNWKLDQPIAWLRLLQSRRNELYLTVWHAAVSVTRFGEISPLWRCVVKLWPFWKCSFTIWHNVEVNVANFIWFWEMFSIPNGKILNQ